MRTYWELKEIYDRKQARKTDRAIPHENNCRVDSPKEGVYRVKLHGNTIITAYPDYMEVTNAGWATPTTHQRLWSIAGVSMGNDSKCGFDETYRIYDRHRGISLPCTGTARIHYDTRRVFDEDVQSDFKTRVVKAVQQEYTRMHTAAWKKIAARVELGEFKPTAHNSLSGAARYEALQHILTADFPDHDMIENFVLGCGTGWAPQSVDKQTWQAAVNDIRGSYYYAHNGYYKEEIKHV